jgi:hypothetical protein
MAVESIRRVRAATPTLLLFSHFGPAAQVAELCELAIRRLRDWTAYVEEAMGESDELDDVTEALTRRTADEFRDEDGSPLDPDRYELLSSVRMNAMGILRYVHRRRDAGRPV